MFEKKRLLLVDDEPLVLEMFQSFLSQEGYWVTVASDAKDAIHALENSSFDVLVCDVLLRDLDGFDIMAIARKRLPSIGVVLITGAPSEDGAERAIAEGAQYLGKPIGFELLLQTVAAATERRDEARG